MVFLIKNFISCELQLLDPMQNFRLQVFYSVAKNLSFTKASQELYITQPAITKHIKELEEEYGLRFFDRKGNRIYLTNAGQVLLDHAEQILSLHRKLDFEMSTFKDRVSGQLKLGASTTIAQYVIPQVLSAFHKKFPKIKLSLLNGNTQYITDTLLKGEIDMGIVEGKSKNKDILYDRFISDEVVAVVNAESELASLGEISLKDLMEIPIVLRERGSGTREVIEYELKKKKIRLSALNVVMYLGSTETLKSFISSSSCLGFLPVVSITKELNRGLYKTVNIKGLKIFRYFDFINPMGPEPSGLNRIFMQFARQHYNF